MFSKVRLILLLLAFLFVACSEPAARTERSYQEEWCDERGGQTEVTLHDRTRVDCVTNTHAIEFDFAKKWAEALGQSLHYSNTTGLRAGIVLICRVPLDNYKYQRLLDIIAARSLDITVWGIGCED